MQLTQISLKNFRVFEEAQLDIKPITIITGANSSGKSSVFKALMLLEDNIEKNQLAELEFSGVNHSLGSFELVKNNKANDGDFVDFEIHLRNNNKIFEKVDSFIFKYSYLQNNDKINNGKLIRLEIKANIENKIVSILIVSLDKNSYKDFLFQGNVECIFNIISSKNPYLKEFRPQMNKIRKEVNAIIIDEERKNRLQELYEEYQLKIQNPEYYLSESKKNRLDNLRLSYNESISEMKLLLQKTEDQEEKEKIENNIKELEDSFNDEEKDFMQEVLSDYKDIYEDDLQLLNSSVDFERYIYNIIFQQIQNNLITYIQKSAFDNEEIRDIKLNNLSFQSEKKNIINALLKDNKWQTSVNELSDIIGNLSISSFLNWDYIEFAKPKIEYIKISEIIGSVLNEDNPSNIQDFFEYLFINTTTKLIELACSELPFASLPAYRSYQNQTYNIAVKRSLIEHLIAEYLNLNYQDLPNRNSTKKFIQTWFDKFGIGEDFYLDNVKGVGTEFYFKIKKDNQIFNLADLGFGIAQIIPIILTCANTNNKNKLICIEEPETNLHPKFQSLLAEMFVEAHKAFGVQFALETHSEYLIRNLQYLVANQTITNEFVKIYYFNRPENITEGIDLVQDIPISKDGEIEVDYEKFWKGFYDEATTLQDKKEQAQLRVEKENLENQIKEISNSCKCLILTEDEDTSICKKVFIDIVGFQKDETVIQSYEGKDNLYPAILSTDILKKDKPNLKYVIFHRDRDIYEGTEIDFVKAKEKIEKLNSKGAIKYFLFLTENYDLESYFINANHIHSIYDSISIGDIENLINEATKNKKDVSLKKLSEKFNTIVDEKKKNRESHNPYDIMQSIEKLYFENTERYRYGKEVLRYLKSLIKSKLGYTPNIIQKTEHIKIPKLEAIAKEIWG